jgi:hypothetical protein
MLCGEIQLYCWGEERLDEHYRPCVGLSEAVEIVAGDVQRAATLAYEVAEKAGWTVQCGQWLCPRCTATWTKLTAAEKMKVAHSTSTKEWRP